MDRKAFISQLGLAGIGLSLAGKFSAVDKTPTMVLCVGARVPESIAKGILDQGTTAHQILDSSNLGFRYYGIPTLVVENKNLWCKKDFSWMFCDQNAIISGAEDATIRSASVIRSIIPEGARVILVAGLSCPASNGMLRGLVDLISCNHEICLTATLPFRFEEIWKESLRTLEYVKSKCTDIRIFDNNTIDAEEIPIKAFWEEQKELTRLVSEYL